MKLRVLPLEPRVVPTVAGLAVGAGPGHAPAAILYRPDGTIVRDILAYDPAFAGGVRVAVADFTGDGRVDLVTAAGPGGGPHVRVFDGQTGTPIREFLAYDADFRGGVFVAAGDVTGDGRPEIITGAGAGGGPHVRAFDGVTGELIRDFFAYDPAFTGGVRVAAGDVIGDAEAEIITGAGPGGGPHVRAFDSTGLVYQVFAYAEAFTGGVRVAVGDLNNDGLQEIITGAGPGGGPHVRAFDATQSCTPLDPRCGAVVRDFFVGDGANGVNVAGLDWNADASSDIFTGIAAFIRGFDGRTGADLASFSLESRFGSGYSLAAGKGDGVPALPRDTAADTSQPGRNLTSPDTPTGSYFFDVNGQAKPLSEYRGPGVLGPIPQGFTDAAYFVPYTVNGSDRFNQPVQSNDWWSNLMFRVEPQSVVGIDGSTYQVRYNNTPMIADPAWLQFVNDQVQVIGEGGSPIVSRRQGLAVFSPNQIFVGNDPATSQPLFGQVIMHRSVTLGLDGSTPVGSVGATGAADEGSLNVRVNSYSDWGVNVGYGDGTSALEFDLTAGVPFAFARKTGPAAAKVWLFPDGGTIEFWDAGLGGRAVAATITLSQANPYGDNTLTFRAGYLILGPEGSTWQLPGELPESTTDGYQLTNTADGTYAIATLPHFIGSTPLADAPLQDRQAVAALFAGGANRVVGSAVSDPTAVFAGQGLVTGFDPATNRLRTRLSVTTETGGETLQVLAAHQLRNLVSADRANLATLADRALTYVTGLGTGTLYRGNSFTTEIRHQGILPFLPSAAVQTDATAAADLYAQFASWYAAYQQTPTIAVNTDDTTYETGYAQLYESMLIADQLSKPTALGLTDDQRANAAAARDRLLLTLKNYLANWFQTDTGKFFQLNTTYDSVIGYPAGFGSDTNLNDHHFHYGYFLKAFAAVGLFDPAFVKSYEPVIELLVRDVANFDRDDEQLPFLRNFNPRSGHNWANGLGPGGQQQESASEAINFAAGLVQLGAVLNRGDWRDQGVYLYATEIESTAEYWFNAYADPANGNPGNWPADYINLGVTQISNVGQSLSGKQINFAPNQGAYYGINWLPTSASSLFLGRNFANDRLWTSRNWSQAVSDFNGEANSLPYPLLIAAFQALVPGTGGADANDPGPSGALTRIAAAGVDQYSGTSKPIALNWAYNLRSLGLVDNSVTADTPYFAAFINGSTRTYTAYNPTSDSTTVTFRDAATGTVLATTTVAAGGMATAIGATTLSDRPTPPARFAGTPLYLQSSDTGLSLQAEPGNAVPPADGEYTSPSRTPYLGSEWIVPARSDNSAAPPTNPDESAVFKSGPITGNYIAGGITRFELFLNSLVEAGVAANDNILGNTFVGVVGYDFDGNGTADRTETYQFIMTGENRYAPYTESMPNSFVVLVSTTGANFSTRMVNGTVNVQLYEGAFNPTNASNRAVGVSVNATPAMGRASRLVIPFTE